jgi:hypothetical protein
MGSPIGLGIIVYSFSSAMGDSSIVGSFFRKKEGNTITSQEDLGDFEFRDVLTWHLIRYRLGKNG